MVEVKKSEFEKWAAEHGIVPDRRYSEPRCLVFEPGNDSRFWLVPPDRNGARALIRAMMGFFRNGGGFFLWPRSSNWGTLADASATCDDASPLRAFVLRQSGGAARLESHAEMEEAVEFLATISEQGFTVREDVFFIPLDGMAILYLSHHGVVHADVKEGERTASLIEHTARSGFELPDEPPDDTFKRPAWMQS